MLRAVSSMFMERVPFPASGPGFFRISPGIVLHKTSLESKFYTFCDLSLWVLAPAALVEVKRFVRDLNKNVSRHVGVRLMFVLR